MSHTETNLAQPVSQKSTGKASNFRWIIIALAFFITLVNYMDRSAISYAIGFLKKEYGFNNDDFGKIASAFGIGYMIMTTGGGIMVDKWGARKVWSLAAVLWSACTALLGIASGFGVFFALRTVLGLSEGPHFPSLTRVVADWLPTQERARSTAIGLAAVPLASAIGAPLITGLIDQVGWRAMFMVLGAIGIIWAVVWALVFRDYPENSKFVNDEELSFIREGAVLNRDRTHHEIRHHELSMGTTTWKFILTNPSIIANNFGFFAFGYLLFFAVHWLPEYFQSTYKVSLESVGHILIVPWLTAAVMLAFAGWLSDYLWKKTGNMRIARTHIMWVSQLLSGLCFIPIMFKPDLNMAIVYLSLGLGFGLMPNACFYAINCDLAKDKAATSLGVMDSFLALAGILAPYLTGYMTQRTGNFNAAFFLLSFFTLTSTLAVFILQRPDKVREELKAG